MSLNLIGLIRASKINEARDQGFRNYVVAAGTDVRMTDYRCTSASITSAVPTAMQTALPDGNFSSITPRPAFTNATVNISYVAGSKLANIIDEGYAERITVEAVQSWDGPTPPHVLGQPFCQVRDFTINAVAKTIVVNITLSNWAYYDAGVQSMPGADSGYNAQLAVRVGFQAEPHFNLRVFTWYLKYVVQPHRVGQPTPITGYGASLLKLDDIWGDYPVGSPFYGSRELVIGVRVVGRPVGSWITGFNEDYGAFSQAEYQFYQNNGGAWDPILYAVTSGVGTNPEPTVDVYGAPNQVVSLRVDSRLIQPFLTPMGSTTADFTIPDQWRLKES